MAITMNDIFLKLSELIEEEHRLRWGNKNNIYIPSTVNLDDPFYSEYESYREKMKGTLFELSTEGQKKLTTAIDKRLRHLINEFLYAINDILEENKEDI